MTGASDQLYAQDKDDSTRWHLWDVTGPVVEQSTYFEVPIAWSAGALTLPSGQRIAVVATGRGVPAGGSTGEVLAKSSADSWDVGWVPAPDEVPAGGDLGDVLTRVTAGVDWEPITGPVPADQEGWPTVAELAQVLDVENLADWQVTLERIMAAAIARVKLEVGSWDEYVDVPDDALAQAALRMGEL